MRLAPRGPSNTLSLIGYGNPMRRPICSLIELLSDYVTLVNFNVCLRKGRSDKQEKGQQHPKDFPGGHAPQYYPGLAPLNFGVRKGSGAFHAVWPLTFLLISKFVI